MANSLRRRLVRSVLRPEMKAKWPLHKKRKPMLQKRKPMPPTAEEIARRERRAARIQKSRRGRCGRCLGHSSPVTIPTTRATYEFAVPYPALGLPFRYGANRQPDDGGGLIL